jgi:hypothetical protein
MELEARTAIARLLRSEGPLDGQLRTSLAELFDPDPPAWQQRKIRIEGRRTGDLTDHVRNTQIAFPSITGREGDHFIPPGGLAFAAIPRRHTPTTST